MSEENLQAAGNSNASESGGEETFRLKINRARNELTFINPANGKEIKIHATIDEDDESSEEESQGKKDPLTADEFRETLTKLDNLGLTWTSDFPPYPTLKEGAKLGQTFAEDFARIQQQYPLFPQEVRAVVLHALLGSTQSPAVVGTEDVLKEKAKALEEILIKPEYRSEFFFKYAIKVPYFSGLDWEVVVKAVEKNVKEMPRTAYALLALAFRDPTDFTKHLDEAAAASETSETKFTTVAVNEHLVDVLLKSLGDVKTALSKARKIAECFNEQSTLPEEGKDEPSKS